MSVSPRAEIKFAGYSGYNQNIGEFLAAALSGWDMAQHGLKEEALRFYKLADSLMPFDNASFGPELSLLRHGAGECNGDSVKSCPPTERQAKIILVEETATRMPTSEGLLPVTVTKNALVAGIRGLVNGFNPSFHAENIVEPREHVMVMSTGRSGTMSLFRLFGGSNLEAHHSFWWHLQVSSRWWMLAALIEGMGWQRPGLEWASTRAAEWLGPKPIIDCNHMDTVFAPVFAAIHPKAKFVYMHRSPEAIFRSFFGKQQWQDNQVMPFDYALTDSRFFYRVPERTLVDKIVWFIRFTEIFAEAMQDALGPRVMRLEAEKLFARDEDEIAKLLDFTNSDIPLKKAKTHFATKINEKADRVVADVDSVLDEFRQRYRYWTQYHLS